MTSNAFALMDLAVSAELADFPPQRRHELISEAAYFRAEARGFVPGSDLDDWLDAEAEIDGQLAEHGWRGAQTGV